MATLHTKLPPDNPGHHGEFLVGKKFEQFTSPLLELWFNVNYIAGVPDLDLVLFDPSVGLYLVEIKSMPISAITVFSNTAFHLEPNLKRDHPSDQLRTGSIKLRDHLKRMPKYFDKRSLPFIQSTVLWSDIDRSEWKSRFSAPEISGFEEACLFSDDLTSYENLISALTKLWFKPLLGTTAPAHARGNHGDMSEFRTALSPGIHETNLSRSTVDEFTRPISATVKVADQYPPGGSYRVSFQGPPGTGKTTILREIGLRNLAAGAKVLHVCFNKILAADQRREYQALRANIDEYGFIDVFDVWQLYKELGHSSGLKGEGQILQNVVAYLESDEGRSFVKYDVILVDESQDLPDDFFRVVEQVARQSASWFIAYGKGQELHNFKIDGQHPSTWLKEFLGESESHVLRRSFRNSTKAFLIAQAIWEKFPDLERARDWILQRLSKITSGEEQFELDLAVPQTKNDLRIETLPDGPSRNVSIRNLLLSSIEDASKANRGGDLLVAVRAPSWRDSSVDAAPLKSSYEVVRDILIEICHELNLQFHNLVPAENRRSDPQAGGVRLVTLQSIRGLSASHVIVFDLAILEKWVEVQDGSVKPPFANYAYIALSRSKVSTILAFENNSISQIETFLLDISGFATTLSIRLNRP